MRKSLIPSKLLKSMDKVIGVWEANPSFTMGPDVTLKKLKDTRAELDSTLKSLVDLNRQVTEQADLRDDAATTGNELLVRTRKAILGYFGADSTQYAQAGGTRTSDRKRPVRKAATAKTNAA